MLKDYLSGSDGYNKKFKRETLLNYGMNRWGLNKSHSVGSTSELIRNCFLDTKNSSLDSKYEEWEKFYFTQAKQKKKDGLQVTREYITSLGQTLYIKLSEVVQHELEQITEEECIDYAYNLVLNRTYEGYRTEIETIYGQLEGAIGEKIEPAPDNWDRTYSVDFFLRFNDKYIGIQIKPITSGQALNHYQWNEMHRINHERFEKDYGGKVFFVFSTKSSSGSKIIYNTEVIEQISNEIKRLSNLV